MRQSVHDAAASKGSTGPRSITPSKAIKLEGTSRTLSGDRWSCSSRRRAVSARLGQTRVAPSTVHTRGRVCLRLGAAIVGTLAPRTDLAQQSWRLDPSAIGAWAWRCSSLFPCQWLPPKGAPSRPGLGRCAHWSAAQRTRFHSWNTPAVGRVGSHPYRRARAWLAPQRASRPAERC
jgi:hypothetical protein